MHVQQQQQQMDTRTTNNNNSDSKQNVVYSSSSLSSSYRTDFNRLHALSTPFIYNSEIYIYVGIVDAWCMHLVAMTNMDSQKNDIFDR